MNRFATTLIAAVSAASLLAACGGKSSNVSTTTSATANAGANDASASSGTGTVLVPAGTVVRGKLQQEISSKKNHDGDTFTVVNNDETIDGHLENVQAAGVGKKPGMVLVFDDVKMASGQTAPADVQIQNIGVFDAKSHHMRTIGMMIGGAVAGHMAAHAAGAHHGGMMGAAGGYMLSQQMKTDIDVKPGTTIVVKFKKDAVASSSDASPAAAATPGP